MGCDISQHLVTCSNGQGGEGRHGAGGSQDHVIVKSSSDVKVMYLLCAILKSVKRSGRLEPQAFYWESSSDSKIIRLTDGHQYKLDGVLSGTQHAYSLSRRAVCN